MLYNISQIVSILSSSPFRHSTSLTAFLDKMDKEGDTLINIDDRRQELKDTTGAEEHDEEAMALVKDEQDHSCQNPSSLSSSSSYKSRYGTKDTIWYAIV